MKVKLLKKFQEFKVGDICDAIRNPMDGTWCAITDFGGVFYMPPDHCDPIEDSDQVNAFSTSDTRPISLMDFIGGNPISITIQFKGCL